MKKTGGGKGKKKSAITFETDRVIEIIPSQMRSLENAYDDDYEKDAELIELGN